MLHVCVIDIYEFTYITVKPSYVKSKIVKILNCRLYQQYLYHLCHFNFEFALYFLSRHYQQLKNIFFRNL